jgi:hypothetical protein
MMAVGSFKKVAGTGLAGRGARDCASARHSGSVARPVPNTAAKGGPS